MMKVCILSDSHKINLEKLPNIKGSETPLVNPGTVGGVGNDPATYILADLDTMVFKPHELSKHIEQKAFT